MSYNYIMESKNTMMFAAGWSQEIDTTDADRERADLLSYISDTHKSVYGYRPRWDADWANNTPLADLRKNAKSLEDDKAEDILFIDLDGKSSLADFMIIASGRSGRHVAALADHVVQDVKKLTGRPASVEGMPNADWFFIFGM